MSEDEGSTSMWWRMMKDLASAGTTQGTSPISISTGIRWVDRRAWRAEGVRDSIRVVTCEGGGGAKLGRSTAWEAAGHLRLPVREA